MATALPSTAEPDGSRPGLLVLGPDHNGISMTPAEFDSVTESVPGHRYELVRGVVIVSPIPSELHDDLSDELGHLLRDYKERHLNGASLDATLPNRYVLGTPQRRIADRVLWAGLGRQPDPNRDPPRATVEFLSSGRRNWCRDLDEKREEYAAAGIEEYWVIDRFRRQMTVFRRRDDRTIEEQVFAEDAVYTTPILPGFELCLRQLFRVADRWRSAETEQGRT